MVKAGDSGILRERLANQRLTAAAFAKPEQVVGWLGAVQAQDFAGALWAVGQRLRAATEPGVERAFERGAVLRTHVLRPTLHFVLPADIGFLLALSAPRIERAMAYYNRKLALTPAVFQKSHRVLEKSLAGGRHLTREELALELARAGIEARGQRLGHLMLQAELDRVVVSGPRRGKRFTYAAFAERVGKQRSLRGDEALAELAGRYFASHGPATVHDFAWWAGLTLTTARRALAAAGAVCRERVLNEKTYYCSPARGSRAAGSTRARSLQRASVAAHLLPNYDEYLISYQDYSPILDAELKAKRWSKDHPLYANLVVIDGKVAGGWQRTIGKDAVEVRVDWVIDADARQKRALRQAADRYGRYLGLPVEYRERRRR